MNKLFKLLFIFFFASCISSYAQGENIKLKILCYNLRFGELASLEQLADFIKKENPDIVALQEVDVNTYRDRAKHQNGKNFISELAYRTGMLSLYGKTIPYMGGYYGIGILSKYPYISSERVLLPFFPEKSKEQRAMLISEIELPDGKSLNFVCTHLDYPSTEIRQKQVEFINRTLLKSDKPVIICGDFNAKPDSKEIAEGMQNWLQVSTSDYTVPAKKAKSKIDYIFCYPTDNWEVVEASTPVIQLSDHLPITSTLILKRGQ